MRMLNFVAVVGAAALSICALPASATTSVEGEFFSFSQFT